MQRVSRGHWKEKKRQLLCSSLKRVDWILPRCVMEKSDQRSETPQEMASEIWCTIKCSGGYGCVSQRKVSLSLLSYVAAALACSEFSLLIPSLFWWQRIECQLMANTSFIPISTCVFQQIYSDGMVCGLLFCEHQIILRHKALTYDEVFCSISSKLNWWM